MKHLKLTIYLIVIGIGVLCLFHRVSAATEFVSIIDPGNGVGTDYSSLFTWEATVQADLSTTTGTMVFSYATASGTIPDGATVIGETSGAVATSTHMASSALQIMLTNIASSTFISGETVYIEGQATSSYYVVISDSGDSVIAVAQCRSTDGTAEARGMSASAAIIIDGWTTSATNYIKIWTDPTDPYGRHNGKWDTTKYRITGADSNDSLLEIAESWTQIIGLQVYSFGTSYSALSPLAAAMSTTLSYNIVRGNSSPASTADGININSPGTSYCYNNIVYDFGDQGIRLNNSGDYFFIYNNTVYNVGGNAYHVNYGTAYAKNNIAQDCDGTCFSTAYDGIFDSTSAYNLSSDGSTPGSYALTTTTVAFLDATNDDFHLDPSDTAARDNGTSTVLWGSILSFWDDIDGTARGSAWDIGADEVPVEFVSTICESKSAGGDCVNMDYSSLGGTTGWEDKVESDLSTSTTRVFSGYITGNLNENATVNLCNGATDLNIDGVVVATTSGQILIDGITGTTTPLNVASSTIWSDETCAGMTNYWTVQGTLDELGASPIAVAMIDGTWSASDTSNLSIVDWETDNDNYIKVYTTDVARHDGAWTDTAYRLDYDSATVSAIRAVEQWVFIDGLQLDNSFRGIFIVDYNNKSLKVKLSNNLIKNSRNNNGTGIVLSGINLTADIWNNIIYGNWANAAYLYGNNIYFYNNTIYNSSDKGIQDVGSVGNVVAINNLVASTTDPFWGTFVTGTDYNATDINDTPGIGSNNLINQSFNFVSIASGTEDFHLGEGSDAIDAGVNLYSTTILSITTDIDGGARPSANSGLDFDIGADEVATKIYRSVGNDSSDLKNATDVTISGFMATFSAGQPDNVGVGDVLQYGAGVYKLAFITGRTSSTTYSVQDWQGYQPTATTSAAVSVYRAHLTLNDWETQTVANVNSGISDAVDDLVVANSMDLVSSNTIMMIAAYASAAGDTEAVTIDGWTTGEDNYIKIYTPVNSNEVGETQRHSGKWENGKYNRNANILINSGSTKIDGLQLFVTGSTHIIDVDDSDDNTTVSISNNIIINDNTAGAMGISFMPAGSGVVVTAWNNIIYGLETTNNQTRGIHSNGGGTLYAYNNTVIGGYYSYYSAIANFHAKNNITQSATVGFIGNFDASSDYNISDIAGDQPASGANDKMGVTVAFVDEINNDFHLSPEDTAAIDAGTNLSTSTELSFANDIDGDVRRTWDIGADEASVYFDSTVMQSGGDFSSLSSWEAANQVDLTATTTLTFNCSATSGLWPFNQSVIGTTSGAMASSTVFATSTNKILLYNITASSTIGGYFQAGEKVIIEGTDGSDNYCILANAGNPAIAVAKIDGAWSNAETSQLTISGWTTGEHNCIRIYTTDTARHQGRWDDSKYRLVINANTRAIYSYVDYMKIDGLQIGVNYNGNSTNIIQYQVDMNGENIVSNNIINGYNKARRGIWAAGANQDADSVFKYYKNIIYGVTYGDLGDGRGSDNYKGMYYIYNNTYAENDVGLMCNLSATYEKIVNNIAVNNNVIDFKDLSNADESNFNISSDDSADDLNGEGNQINETISFLDSANDDFRLATEDTAARDAGTSTANDPYIQVTTDIEGQERYDAHTDIGADEGATIIYRSVGNDTSNLNTVSATVSITSTSTAIFSAELPANIGVGDVLQYGGAGYYTLAFISGRTSSTTYSVQARDGTSAQATTSANVSIFRAHEFLDDWEDQLEADVNDGIDASVDDLVLYPKASLDLTASNTAMFVPCYASTSPDNLAVSIVGWTTATTSYINIYTPVSINEVGLKQRHNGIWSNSAYRIISDGYPEAFSGVILIQEDYTRVNGLQIALSNDGSSYRGGIYIKDISENSQIFTNSNIVKNINSQQSNQRGISNLSGVGEWYIINNIIYGFNYMDQYGIRIDPGSANIFNNTVADTYYGIACNMFASSTIRNNALFNNYDDFTWMQVTTPEYNASDDGDGTNPINISPGAVEAEDWARAFADYANYNFQIKDTYSPLYDAGTTITIVTDDILGTTRPTHDAYDVGAFEFTENRPGFRFSPGGHFEFQGHFEFK